MPNTEYMVRAGCLACGQEWETWGIAWQTLVLRNGELDPDRDEDMHPVDWVLGRQTCPACMSDHYVSVMHVEQGETVKPFANAHPRPPTLYGFHAYPDGSPIAVAVLDEHALSDLIRAGAVVLQVPTRPDGSETLTVVMIAPGGTAADVERIAQLVAERPRPRALSRSETERPGQS